MLKLYLILFILCSWSEAALALNWKFWQGSDENQKEYDFPSCKPFETLSSARPIESCHGELSEWANPSLAGIELARDVKNISLISNQEALTLELKKFILDSLESKIKNQLELKDCLALIVGRHGPLSEWCENKAEVLRSQTRTYYPRMRLHMALKRPIANTTVGEEPLFEIDRSIYHARERTQILPISEAEIPKIKEQFDEETQTYRQEWFELHKDKGCIEEDERGLFRFQGKCPPLHQLHLNDYVNYTRQEKTKEHDALYRQMLGQSPHFAFIGEAVLPSNEAALNVILVNSMGDLLDQSIKEYENLKKREDFNFIYRYPDLIEAFLQKKGASELVCGGLQKMHDKYGEGGWLDLTSDIGLGLAALVGGGTCVLTSGLTCAAFVAVGAEGLFLANDQARVEEGLSLYKAGFVESSRVDELERSRNFSLALAPLSLVGLESGKGVARSFARRHLTRQALKNTGHWLHYTATNVLQNKSWIRAAKNNLAHLYFDVENSALKRLNDSLGDKNLVTSFTNLHKHILFDELEVLIQKFPGLKIEKYSDFKSSRFAFNFPGGVVPPHFERELSNVMKKVGQRFDQEVKLIDGIDVGKEIPHKWFTAGVGASADQAGLASRQARSLKREGTLTAFKDVGEILSQTRDSVENNRSFLEKALTAQGAQKLLMRADNEATVPSLEVFELMRKAKGKSAQEIKLLIKKRFDVDIDQESALALIKYTDDVDQFSPGLWLPERVVANLDEAEYGGFSADFKGMGAKNLQQVALDLAHTEDTLAQSVARLRKGEESVTVGFDEAKTNYQQLIERELKSIGVGVVNKCSGDDCVSLPAKALTREQEERVVQKIAQSGAPDGYRLSFIPPGIEIKARSTLAVHGELIEKEVRAMLTGFGGDKIHPELMSDLTIAVRMPAAVGQGKVELVVAAGHKTSLTPEVQKLLNQSLQVATDKVNQNLAGELGSNFAYQSSY